MEPIEFQSGSGGPPSAHLRSCPCCGLVTRVPPLTDTQRARCPRCQARLPNPAIEAGRATKVSVRVAAASLAALALYPSAVTLPIMHIDEMGYSSDASIWSGSLGLLRSGDYFAGGVVFVCSMVFPLFKLIGLLGVTVFRRHLQRSTRRIGWRLVDLSGRWGLLDVLLVAVVVAWVKVGDLVVISPGPAAFAFTLMVLMSLLASALYDPHALWDETPVRTSHRS